ncbi:hypothetical protein Megpolyxen_01399 [Candidatus Megaera polyxenophila]|nr:hypothetical protein Megpolyxen_01399 [Candidatus Megaera polyxenophila]
MTKFKIFIGIFFITASLLIACDDYLSPTIEIFNKTETPTTVEQEQNKSKKKEQKQENNSNQEIINQY